MNDYSQYGEQAAILASVPEMGTFLDLGAWDPFKFSNTRALYEKGWGGVFVDASPDAVIRLVKEYWRDPNVKVISGAVTLESTIPQKMNLTADAMTTGDNITLEKWSGKVNYYGVSHVAAVKLSVLLSYHQYDFVNIDLEGISCDVFTHLLSTHGARPACICLEHDGHHEKMAAFATVFGYDVVMRNGTNMVFKQRSGI